MLKKHIEALRVISRQIECTQNIENFQKNVDMCVKWEHFWERFNINFQSFVLPDAVDLAYMLIMLIFLKTSRAKRRPTECIQKY